MSRSKRPRTRAVAAAENAGQYHSDDIRTEYHEITDFTRIDVKRDIVRDSVTLRDFLFSEHLRVYAHKGPGKVIQRGPYRNNREKNFHEIKRMGVPLFYIVWSPKNNRGKLGYCSKVASTARLLTHLMYWDDARLVTLFGFNKLSDDRVYFGKDQNFLLGHEHVFETKLKAQLRNYIEEHKHTKLQGEEWAKQENSLKEYCLFVGQTYYE